MKNGLLRSARSERKWLRPLGIEIDLEPINRYLLGNRTTVDSILQIIARIGAPHVRLLADCYHMHLEEASIGAAWPRRAGPAACYASRRNPDNWLSPQSLRCRV